MAPVTKETILKKLETLYWSVFNDSKWHIALWVAERQGKNIDLFEKPCLPEVTRIEDMTEPQLRDFMDALEKFYPELKHPPPPCIGGIGRSLKNPF